jgi:glycosyltransferase involved in cell wall biosynthesis
VRRVVLHPGRPGNTIFKKIVNNLTIIRQIRNEIRKAKADVAICFLDQMSIWTVWATRGISIPVIVSERNNMEMHLLRQPLKGLKALSFRHADAVIVQTERILQMTRGYVSTGVVIPNPIPEPLLTMAPSPSIDALLQKDGLKKTVISMGRLTGQKHFDALLKAFAAVSESHKEWRLVILGEGPLENELKKLSTELGIACRVHFPGKIKDPEQLLKNADLFVLSSFYEGFPNALAEAMAIGLPVISFDCPTGPRELIRNNTDGLLVPPDDIPALAGAMDYLMTDGKERQRLAAHGPEILERFGVEKTMDMWENLISELSRNKKAGYRSFDSTGTKRQ